MTGEMFDSAGGNIPAGAQNILLPTDGRYSANNALVKAKFPNARYQTYTAIGQVPAEWIDTEPGCVWPEISAVLLWDQWKANGITKGFYCSTSVRPNIEKLLHPGDNPEWFEADPTGVSHIRAGDTETQWGWFGSYDETEIPDPPTPPTPPPVPAPIPTEEIEMLMIRRGTDAPIATFDGTHKYHVLSPATVTALEQAGVKLVVVDPSDYDAIPLAT